MTWQKVKLTTGKWNRLSRYETSAHTDPDTDQGSVCYHTTEIVWWNQDEIVLRSGGWETVTTKRKMNQASKQFGLGFSVSQENWDWFVTTPSGSIIPFHDGIRFAR